jgi:hypothetical protein
VLPYRKPRLTARPDVPRLIDPGCHFLFEEIDIVGRETFGAEWTGKELLARPLPEIGSEISRPWPYTIGIMMRRHNVGALNVVTNFQRPGAPNFDEGWFALDRPDGTVLYFPNESGADAAWRELFATAVAELHARRRFERARDEVRTRLATTRWKAFVLNRDSGNQHELYAEHWRSDRSAQTFELGDDPDKWASPNWVSLTIDRHDVSGNVIVRKKAPATKRGRPAEYNWPQVKARLQDYVAEDGPVQSSTELLQKCSDFAAELHPDGQTPDDSTIREAVRKHALAETAKLPPGK